VKSFVFFVPFVVKKTANIVSSRQRGGGSLGWFGAFSKFIFGREVRCLEIPLRLKLVLYLNNRRKEP
jgi:hypothetical protein